jgi:Fe-S oxidoreductase
MSKPIDRLLAEAQHELGTLNAEMQRVAANTDNPNDPALIEIDEKITSARKAIKRLELLAANRAKGITAEQRAARKAARRVAALKVMSLAQSRIDLAAKLDTELARVGTLLAEWASLGHECRAAFSSVHRPSPDFDYLALDYASGSNGAIVGALESVLQAAGVGVVGIPLEQQFLRPKDMRQSLTEAAKHNAARMEGMLQGHRFGHGDITLNDRFDKE